MFVKHNPLGEIIFATFCSKNRIPIKQVFTDLTFENPCIPDSSVQPVLPAQL
jgi:hypothetical protein